MADSEIKIKATLDLAEAKASLSTLGREVDASMSTAANGAQKLGKSLDQVATSAKLSAQQIGQIALGFSGMGIKLAATVADAQGYHKEAGYLSAISSGALQGAQLAMMMDRKPWPRLRLSAVAQPALGTISRKNPKPAPRRTPGRRPSSATRT